MTHDRIRTLLVEDNPGDARLIEEELAEADQPFSLTWVERLDDALEQIGREETDVVLLDLSLPDSDGLETVSALHDAAPTIPIVVLTGHEDEQLGAEAVREGAEDYLVKGQVDGDRLSRAARYAIERKAARRELEQLRKRVSMNEKLAALGALVSGISEEIRQSTTHLTNTIYELRQRVEEEARRDPELGALVEDVGDRSAAAMDGIKRIEELIRELRRFTRSGTESESAVSLDAPVREAVDLFRRTYQSQIMLKADLQQTPPVRIHRIQIHQVVLNLLNNASEAMEEGGIVEVATHGDDEGAWLVVRDHGPGVSRYVRERMFEPFFTTKEDAAGLGLAVTRRIVEAHEGEISYDAPEDGGARFRVRLPPVEA